ncbi:MAG: MarR family transcriptional regulator [Phycisphaerales bacterium]|nr:MarR family transcriptional regulator [Phycisphaerales bacterium]
MELDPAVRQFVLHWGEMGSRWGINRTMAQIHALLYSSPEPIAAEEIAQVLGVARSNVSTCLRELQNWGIIRITHVLGDRRDYFECRMDVWDMFRIVLAQRKKREIDPTLETLRECVAMAAQGDTDPLTEKRLREMLEFFETVTDWYEQIQSMPTGAVMKFVKYAPKVKRLLGVGA